MRRSMFRWGPAWMREERGERACSNTVPPRSGLNPCGKQPGLSMCRSMFRWGAPGGQIFPSFGFDSGPVPCIDPAFRVPTTLSVAAETAAGSTLNLDRTEHVARPSSGLILFEDAHLLVVNKPAGINTHAPAPYAGEG